MFMDETRDTTEKGLKMKKHFPRKGSAIINWISNNIFTRYGPIHLHFVLMICVFMCIPTYFICFKTLFK